MKQDLPALTLKDIVAFLAQELKQQSPEDFDALFESRFNTYDPTYQINMLEWRGGQSSLDEFWTLNELHSFIIAENKEHFESHFTDKYLPETQLIIGRYNNDVYHILQRLQTRRVLAVCDVWFRIIAAHFVDKFKNQFDLRDEKQLARLKSAVNKKPVVMNPKRAEFLDDIVEQIVRVAER